MKVCVFIAKGFEETEAIGVVDVLRRGMVEVDLVSITDSLEVVSAHSIKIICDKIFRDMDTSNYDMIVFPGGVNGVEEIRRFEPMRKIISYFHENNKYLAAICAGPVILGDAGVLENRNFTCYEGFEKFIQNGIYSKERVITTGNIITSNCVGSVIEFGLKLLAVLKGEDISNDIRSKMNLC